MDINVALIITFALATLGETLIPGPTLALVFESRASATKKEVIELIAGITAANAVWVIVAIFIIYTGNTWFKETALPVLTYFGTAYLVYLASRRILSSSILFITGAAEDTTHTSINGHFKTGFMAHFINPLTIAYYVTTFGLATMEQSIETKIGFGLIAIFSDLIVYTLIGCVSFGNIEIIFRKPFFRLLAGCALFYLIVHVYSNPSESEHNLSITPPIMIFMLFGFLCAAILEAYCQVKSRTNKSNSILWRISKLWSIWFSIFAVLGAFYSLLSEPHGSVFSLSDSMEVYFRICIIVATVLAITLSFVKSYGELQDEKNQKTDSDSVSADCWHASPFGAGIASFMFLAAIFILMWVTDFKIQ